MIIRDWATIRSSVTERAPLRGLVSVLLTIVLASSAVAGLFLLHDYANKRHQAEVTLLKLAEGSTEHGQLEWKVFAQGRYDKALDDEHHTIHAKIDTTKRELAALLGPTDERYLLVVDRYDDYHHSIGDAFALVKQGKLAEAEARDESQVRPRFRDLQDALASSLTSLRADAKRADQISLMGTLGIVATLAALVFYWRHERQRQAVRLILAEQRGLRRSEARFRRLVQSSSDVVMVIDAQGLVTSASPSLKQVFGHEPDAVVGSPLRELLAQADGVQIEALVSAAKAGAWSSKSIAYRLASPNGKWFHVETTATNLLSDEDVDGIVLNSRDATQRRFLELQLKHRAFHDPLTGLANRTLFGERVDHALTQLVRNPGRIAVIFIDLDDFKLVNDSMGHSIGDELLVAVAERMKAVLRPEDTACRMGGDEFAVLVENVDDEASIGEIAQRILEEISVSFELGDRKVLVTASAGVAFADGSDTAETLLRNADLAMYSSKGDGKGRLAHYVHDMHRDVVSHLELKAGMQDALEAQDFYLEYQPIVALADQRTVGVEALVRWKHPKQGVVSPLDFITLAEETGFIVPLGRFVLRRACEQAAAWLAELSDDDFYVTVNLSPRQLQHERIVDEVAEALADAHLLPKHLVLEVTESSLATQTPEALQRMADLRELGVRLAIDDFGTGYSSLHLLQNFPVDILKIDKAFVDAIGRGESSSSLTEAILGLADVLHVAAIAEGIETYEQLDELITLKCELGQGYLFARPSSPAEVSRILRGERSHRFRPAQNV